MTESEQLVLADEWHVTLLVRQRASPRLVGRWSELTYEALVAAALTARSRFGSAGGQSRIAVRGGVRGIATGNPP